MTLDRSGLIRNAPVWVLVLILAGMPIAVAAEPTPLEIAKHCDLYGKMSVDDAIHSITSFLAAWNSTNSVGQKLYDVEYHIDERIYDCYWKNATEWEHIRLSWANVIEIRAEAGGLFSSTLLRFILLLKKRLYLYGGDTVIQRHP